MTGSEFVGMMIKNSWVRICDLGNRYSHIDRRYVISITFPGNVYDLKANTELKCHEQSTRLGKVRYSVKQENGKNTSIQATVLRELTRQYNGPTYSLDELR